MSRCLVPYLLQAPRRRLPRRREQVHLLLCFADHWEPKYKRASPELAQARVQRWVQEYPQQFGRFRDSDGRTPRHTFFYPIEEYEPEYLDALAGLCRAGFGEVEVHLHHDRDTAEALQARLLDFKQVLAQRHGLLSRDRETGELAYGFIHGNWALCHSRPDGKWCGVNDELTVLRRTGCYADFTLPSAPSPTQTRKINSIYYARSTPDRPRCHETGIDVGAGPPPDDALMLIQGPLLIRWERRGWTLRPRLENGCIQHGMTANVGRLRVLVARRIQVPARKDWFFVKLHMHGTMEDSHEALLGESMVRFHEGLAQMAADNPAFHYHYVTAREMYNLVKAAEAGWRGPVAAARDFRLVWNGSEPHVGQDSKPGRLLSGLES